MHLVCHVHSNVDLTWNKILIAIIGYKTIKIISLALLVLIVLIYTIMSLF